MAKDKNSKSSTSESKLDDTASEQVADNASDETQPQPENKTLADTDTQQVADDALTKLKAQMDSERSQATQTNSGKTKQASKPELEPTSSTGSADKSRQSTRTSATTEQKPASSATTKAVKPARSWFAILAFLLSLGAATGVAFIAWQGQLWLDNQQQIEQLKQQSLLNNQQTIRQLQSRITELQNAQTKQVSNYDTVQQSLNAYAARINELGQSQPNFWLAAESHYLINLAERRLLVEQDVDTAVQLLLDANQRLTAMQDPSVFHIRTAISEDVAALYALETPNTDDVYLTLAGLISEIQQLPLAQAYLPKTKDVTAPDETVSDNVNDWQQNLTTSIQRFFGHFITVTKRDTQVQPQLPADQQWYVRANMTTQLLMAQTATLDHHQTRYNDALDKLTLWVQQYFDTNNDRVIAYMTTLNALTKTDVALTLPKGLTAQALISNYVTEQRALKHADANVEENRHD